jgi:hypothetical protein
MPNECWQPDATHWKLADGTEVEIVNVIEVLILDPPPCHTRAPRRSAGRASWCDGLPAANLVERDLDEPLVG